MITLIKLTKPEEFENLKKNDLILVKWADYQVKHLPNCKKIMFYNIYENKKRSDEIICKLRGNHYFNWKIYLQNLSWAEEVYLVKEN